MPIAAALAAAAFVAACGSGTSLTGAPVEQPKAVWGQPTGGKSPRALLILIHGGGWDGLNPVGLKDEIETSIIFRRIGYETLSVDYRRGAQGVADVERFYREARRRVGSRLPICAFGVSAGAHIALMLAVRNPDLACVIDLAGPTDLPALRSGPGDAQGYRIATEAFGTGLLSQFSPALHAGSIKAKLLLIYAQDDELVPAAQGQAMAHADRAARLIVLPPGAAPFVHTGVGAPVSKSGVDPTAKGKAELAEAAFLEQSTVRRSH